MEVHTLWTYCANKSWYVQLQFGMPYVLFKWPSIEPCAICFRPFFGNPVLGILDLGSFE